MEKKTIIVVISVLFASMLIGTQPFETAKANPIPSGQISPPPIIIQSPLNATYDQNGIPLNFTVVGASEYYSMTYKLSYIYYICDGQFHDYSLGMNLDRDQYCTNLTGLSKGQHTLTVYAEGVGSYYISSSQWTQYTVESTQTVTFTVTKDLETTPSSSPTQTPSPTLSPTPSLTASPSPVSPSLSPSQSQAPQLALEVIDVIKLRNYGGFYGAVYDSGTDEVYIANVDFNLVSVVSAGNRTEVAEVPVGNQPLGVAYDSGKGEIFVANFASNSVSVISDSNRTVVSTINVGSHPTALAYDYGKGEVFVANRDDNTVSVISDSTNTVVATIPVGKAPYGVAYSPKGEVYVTNNDDNTVSVISDDTYTVVETITSQQQPFALTYDSAHGQIFAAHMESWSVSVISDFSDPSPSPSPSQTQTQQPTSEPTQPAHSTSPPNHNLIIITAGVVAAIVVVAVGGLVYFKKRKG